MRKLLSAAAVAVLFCTSVPSQAAFTYVGTLLGSNEVGNPGNLNAVGTGVAVIDGANVEVTFTFSNLAANLTGAHIHRGAAGVNGPIIIDFDPPSIGVGPGTFSFTRSVVDADAFEITNGDPSNFYFNLHTTDFRAGAIRGQLVSVVPLPQSFALMGFGLAAMGASLRRRARAER